MATTTEKRRPCPCNQRAKAGTYVTKSPLTNTTEGVYLDNNGSTRVHESVVQTMLPYFTSVYGNASASNHQGKLARIAAENARETIAALWGLDASKQAARNLVFTSGSSESVNMFLRGVVKALSYDAEHVRETVEEPSRLLNSVLARLADGALPHIVTTNIEHDCVRETLKDLQEHGQCTYEEAHVDGYGVVHVETLQECIERNPHTVLVCVMSANNELGTIQPIEEIGKLAADHEIYFFSDSTQVAGKLPMRPRDVGLHGACISGHKIHGPKGVGCLYIDERVPFVHVATGGRQENDRRAGTLNLPGIVGLAAAMQYNLRAETVARYQHDVAELRDELESRMFELFGDAVVVNGVEVAPLDPVARTLQRIDHRMPNTLSICVANIDSRDLAEKLSKVGISIGTGSACKNGAASTVIDAIGRTTAQERGTLRLSLSLYTTRAEIDLLLEQMRIALNMPTAAAVAAAAANRLRSAPLPRRIVGPVPGPNMDDDDASDDDDESTSNTRYRRHTTSSAARRRSAAPPPPHPLRSTRGSSSHSSGSGRRTRSRTLGFHH